MDTKLCDALQPLAFPSWLAAGSTTASLVGTVGIPAGTSLAVVIVIILVIVVLIILGVW